MLGSWRGLPTSCHSLRQPLIGIHFSFSSAAGSAQRRSHTLTAALVQAVSPPCLRCGLYTGHRCQLGSLPGDGLRYKGHPYWELAPCSCPAPEFQEAGITTPAWGCPRSSFSSDVLGISLNVNRSVCPLPRVGSSRWRNGGISSI